MRLTRSDHGFPSTVLAVTAVALIPSRAFRSSTPFTVHTPQTCHGAVWSLPGQLPGIQPKPILLGTPCRVSKNVYPQPPRRTFQPPQTLPWMPAGNRVPLPAESAARLHHPDITPRKRAGSDPLPEGEGQGQVFKKMKSTSRSKTTFICHRRNMRRHHESAEL